MNQHCNFETPNVVHENVSSRAFLNRHLGPNSTDEATMLAALGVASRAQLIQHIVPKSIASTQAMQLPQPVSEVQALDELKTIAKKNRLMRSYIGQGYYPCHTPGVILRNILENPAWYTAYTPYQAEISQGRLEALLNFQTMVCDLTGMAISGASMLDEATAAAEAMTLAKRSNKSPSNTLLVDAEVLPQTLAVLQTRAEPLGISIKTWHANDPLDADSFALLLQYPGASGVLRDDTELIVGYKAATKNTTGHTGTVIVAADLLALTLLKSPKELGADIAIGTTQRLGMPLCNGGPHAAYLACSDELKRSMPGRLVGISKDVHGNPGYRLSLQTREQHIRREKATSNICTAQVLPAVVASMYVVYHGPNGLRAIAQRIAGLTYSLYVGLQALGFTCTNTDAFDTLTIATRAKTEELILSTQTNGINLRQVNSTHVGISLDETTTVADVQALLSHFAKLTNSIVPIAADALGNTLIPNSLARTSDYLTHPVFNSHQSETGMLRYLRRLSDKDLALDRSMIPLGSCTMKLNATSEMIPITWPEFADIHPFAPADQREGYRILNRQLSAWLCEITGYAGVNLQPNAGSQGEYAGLLAIRAFHRAAGQPQRTVCLIPSSAHGTNPASAQMVGFEVVVTACDANGNVDMNDLKAKCEQYSEQLAVVMITYPSTHGVFESEVTNLCQLVHHHGGKVYVDGANMNALVGLAAPGKFGGDVSHLNLHKTFCIPHGGGGPGVGPVCVAKDLTPYLPPEHGPGIVSAAPLGNAGVLPISWMYIRMMGAEGLKTATEIAILNANYISRQLAAFYPTLYASQDGWVAHECILDLRPLKELTGGANGVSAEDVAKRLIDYGFHAPTLSFPVAGTLMVEPTESEPLQEIDRFIDAMKRIYAEMMQVAQGTWPNDDNPLKNAPHTAASLLTDTWDRPYSREQAAYPLASLRATKYWPPVGRIDNVYGDRNLFCSCQPVEAYTDSAS